VAVRDYAQRLLVWGEAGKLGVYSLSASDFAEPLDAFFPVLSASLSRICARIALVALFHIRRFVFGLVLSDSLARGCGQQ